MEKEPVEDAQAETQLSTANQPQAVMLTPKQLKSQMDRDQSMRSIVTEYISKNMVDGTDYGVIAGLSKKKSLFKPGSEKFCSLFKIRPVFRKDSDTVEMLGNTPGIVAYICELLDTKGRIVGEGRGTFKVDVNGRDFDINKGVKIAEKRAQIDAVLRTGGLSDFFTQDLEDAPKTQTVSPIVVDRPASIAQINLIERLSKDLGVDAPKPTSLAEASKVIQDMQAMR